MVTRRSFRRDFKLLLCRDVVTGNISKAQACREHGLSPGMLDRWVDQYKVRGEDAFPASDEPGAVLGVAERMKELEALVGRLTLENEFLKRVLQKGDLARERK